MTVFIIKTVLRKCALDKVLMLPVEVTANVLKDTPAAIQDVPNKSKKEKLAPELMNVLTQMLAITPHVLNITP